jgi:ribose/xylose/arabinose/galactoside ABC-type transport system permease subunit
VIVLETGLRISRQSFQSLKARRSSAAGLALFYALVLIIFSVLSPRFRTEDNYKNLLIGYSHIGILAIGMSFPILLAGIDLSVGSIIGVVGMTVFDLSLISHVSGIVAIVAALILGAALGALNGFLVVKLNLSPFIVTLAAMATWRGTTYAISGRQLYRDLSVAPITDKLLLWIDGSFGPIPRASVYMVVIGLAAYWLLAHTKLGRDIYAVGGNERAAYLAGINVTRIKILAYAISGLCSGVVALILSSRLSTSPEDLGTGIELSAIAAAVVGGVSLLGGVGGTLGPVLGAFLIGTVYVGMQLENVTTYAQPVVAGVILVGAVGYDRLRQVRERRELVRERVRRRPASETIRTAPGVAS